MKLKLSLPKTFDWVLYLIPILLTIIGLATIYSLTYYNNQISLFYNQIINFIVGLVLMTIFTFFDYRHFKGVGWILYLIGLVLLVLLFFIGKSSFGSTRWIDLKFFDLQPSELMKLFLIIILSKYLSDNFGKINWKKILFCFILGAIPAVMVLKQPDLGSFAVLMVSIFAVVFSAKLTRKQIFGIILATILIVPLGWFSLKNYQKERLYTFINPSHDKFGSGYNVLQSTIAVGNGGILGKGLGHGPQSQLNFLPVAHTDFIFAGLAEASGFLGSIFVIILFTILSLRIVNVANISKDNFGRFVAIGILSIMVFQYFVNIAMNIGIMPVTGIPLPFVSYGGSSMLLSMICIGVLQSIYLRHKKITF